LIKDGNGVDEVKKYASETADDIGEEIILGRIRHQDYVKLPLSVNEGLSWDQALK
jgi:hypothetical protein